MMMQRASWLGLAAAMGAMLAGFGCSSDNGGGSGGSGASSSSTTTTGSSMSSSSSGDMSSSSSGGGTGGMSSSSSSGSTTSSSGAGGGGSYADCDACTNIDTGAAAHECKAAKDKCMADAGCQQIYNCSYFGSGCSSDKDGACCTLACYKSTNASQASIALYEAFDGCIYCQTCPKVQGCDWTPYCNVFKPGGDSVCMP